MKLTRADLKKMLKPIVREFVEEALEDLLTEGFIKETIQESVLKGDTISHVITEVFRGMADNQPVALGGSRPPATRNRPVRQLQTEEYDEDEPQNSTLAKIRELSQNSELATILKNKANMTEAAEQQMNQRDSQQQRRKGGINWGSLANAIPPDNDSVMHHTTLEEAKNPLSGVSGEGIDLGIIQELSSNSLWGKDKLQRFLNMSPQNYAWSKAPIDSIAGQKIQ